MRDIIVTDDNIHIIDSYTITDRAIMEDTLLNLQDLYPDCKVWNRSINSLIREWCGHNLLYSLNIAPDRTKDVDLNYPLPWYEEVGYFVLNLLYYVIR